MAIAAIIKTILCIWFGIEIYLVLSGSDYGVLNWLIDKLGW